MEGKVSIPHTKEVKSQDVFLTDPRNGGHHDPGKQQSCTPGQGPAGSRAGAQMPVA